MGFGGTGFGVFDLGLSPLSASKEGGGGAAAAEEEEEGEVDDICMHVCICMHMCVYVCV